MTPGSDTASPSYAELLLRALPRPIKSEEDAKQVQRHIDALLDKSDDLTEDEEDLLTLLGTLVLEWEEGKYDLPAVSPLDMLRVLIEDNGLRQKDLVGPVFPTPGIASEVLSGKRKLTYDFVRRLAAYFHVSPEVFYP